MPYLTFKDHKFYIVPKLGFILASYVKQYNIWYINWSEVKTHDWGRA